MKTEKTKYLSFQKIWHKSFVVGIGVGWADDNTFCVLVQLGWWVLVIGPHVD